MAQAGLSAWVCGALTVMPQPLALCTKLWRGLDHLPMFPTPTQRMGLARWDPLPCSVWSHGEPVLRICDPGNTGFSSVILFYF